MKKIYKTVLWVLACAPLISSCVDFLDVSDELAEQRTYESIFSSPEDTRRWLAQAYVGLPDYTNIFAPNGYSNPWTILSDELDLSGQANDWNFEEITSSHFRAHRRDYWRYIRQVNVFLERAQVIPKFGTADFIGEEELTFLKAQARFLRAYYHFLLFELYGPIPIMDRVISPDDTEIDFERNSVDEVIEFIYDELTEIADDLRDPDLQEEATLAIPTKGAALALRAKVMVYAASPLFNGGYKAALNVSNKDGKRLFPDYNQNKWQKALDACQSFIDYANAGHYELYKEYDENGNLDPDKSIYELFNSFNKEVIFANSGTSWGNVSNQSGYDGLSIPRGARGGSATTGRLSVLQELVDDFFMMDGLSIDESPLYSEVGLTQSASEDLTGNTEAETYRMYINREPRFYQCVFYNGRKWHVGGERIEFHQGGNTSMTGESYAKSGYICYKRVHRSLYDMGSHPRSKYRPGIIFRLADFYLMYAEALNEVSPDDPRVIEYIDKVRERAGIPLLKDIKPQIVGNKEAQREAIIRERRVELATEGQRYFDVRRWMIAGNTPGKGGQGGNFHGMDMSSGMSGFYDRTVIEKRRWQENMYLAPIDINEMQNSRLLIQNPGY